MTIIRGTRRPSGVSRGQALVEFSLALIPFLLILMGIADLGRGIYMNNGVSEAAREIARTTAVHLCDSPCTVGNSAQTTSTVNTQKNLVPGLASPSSSITYQCIFVNDAAATCTSGNYIKVTVSVPYSALTPLLSMVAPTTLTASAHIEIP
jgi:Flp pilus assembly protein TadG